jgi:hypothetical protein
MRYRSMSQRLRSTYPILLLLNNGHKEQDQNSKSHPIKDDIRVWSIESFDGILLVGASAYPTTYDIIGQIYDIKKSSH